MKIDFSKVFKEDLTTYGNTLRLEYYDLGDDVKRELPAIWDNDTLYITLDFSDTEFNIFNVYYNTYSNPEFKLAFSILASEFIDACNSKDISQTNEPDRIDHNYLSIKLPEPTIANIVCLSRSEIVDFLESESIIPGVNIYQVLTNNKEEYLTKDSFESYLKNNKSKNTDFPFYYDETGEGISNINYKKKYTSISIYPENLSKSGDIYFTSMNETIQISGTVTFDLYKINGDEKILDSEGCIETLINSDLFEVESDIISYAIDNSEKTIYFSNDNEPNTTIKLQASIENIKSNIVEIGLIEDVRVEYSSNFYEEDGNVVLLFDSDINNKGYNPDESDQKNTNIVIITDANVDPEDIIIEPETDEFWDYFEIYKSFEKKGYDTYTERFIYKVELSTITENLSSSWYPIVNGESTLIPCTIILGGREVSTFYCVQKGQSTGLGLRNKDNNSLVESITIDDLSPKLKKKEFIAEGNIEGYHLRTYVEDDNIYNNSGCTRSEIDDKNVVTLYSTVSTQNKKIGNLVLDRVSDTDLYDENNWRDVISKGYSSKISVPIISTSKRSANWWIRTDSDYCCNDTKLLIFNNIEGESKEVDFHCDWSTSLTVTVKTGEEEFEKYFECTKKSQLSTGTSDSVTTLVISLKKTFESATTWGPKIDNLPILLNIGHGLHSEDLYVVIAPNYQSPISFYDLDYNKISNLAFSYNKSSNDIYINYSNENVEDNPDFEYWRVFDKTLENLKITPRNNNHNLKTKDVVTGTSLVSIPESLTTNNELGELVVIGSYNEIKTWNNYYEDWRNQLLDKTSRTLTIDYERNSEELSPSFSVFLKNPDGTSVVLEDQSEIKLDYIGLYKLNVKSRSKYRVLLEDTNVSDGFYFYDRSTNTIEEDIILVDEGRYNNFKGSEVCFAYIGGEVGNFNSYSRRLRTTVKVINLEDNSSMLFYLYRIYDELDSNVTIEELEDTYVNEENSKYIILNAGENITSINSKIKYKAFLETEVTIKETGVVDSKLNIEYSRKESMNYSEFNNTSSLTRNRIVSSFYSRGYDHSELEFTIPDSDYINSSGLSYPMPCLAKVNISTPTYKRGKTKEGLEAFIYQLLPCPETVLGSSAVYISYKKGEVGMISFKTQSGGTVEFSAIKEKDPGFKILSRNREDNGWGSLTISAGDSMSEDYAGEEDIVIGLLKVTTYVKDTEFIEDENGGSITPYSQIAVNEMVPPNIKYVNVILQCKANYNNKLITSDNIIDYHGETLIFQISKKNQSDAVKIPAMIPGVSSKSYDNSNETLTVTYQDRLVRGNYDNYGYSFYPESWLSSTYYYTSIRNKIGSFTSGQLASDFSIIVGNESVSTGSVVQEPWPTGIYSPSTSKIYFGNNNNSIDYYVDYNDTSWDFIFNLIKFPGTLDKNIEVTKTGVTYEIIDKSSNTNINLNSTTRNKVEYNRLYISFSYNSSEDQKFLASIKIFDEKGDNSIVLNIYQEARSVYTGELYKGYSTVGSSKLVTSEDKLDAIAISASNKMIYPEHAYIVTDATFLSSSGPEYTFYLSNGLISSQSAFDHNFSLSYTNLGSVRKEGDDTEYNLYEIKLTGGITKFKFSSSSSFSGEINTSAAYLPYHGNYEIYLGGTSLFTLKYYHGVSNMTISPIRKITLGSTMKIVDYENEYEEQKKFYSTSVYSSNSSIDKTSSSYYNTYTMNNSINLVYVDVDSTLNDAGLFYPTNFQNTGYYGAFIIDSITRSEWEKTDSGWSVKSIKSFSISGSNHSDSSVQLIPNFADKVLLQSIEVPNYIDDVEPYSDSSGNSISNWWVEFEKSSNNNLNRAGFMFEIPKSTFQFSNNVYTVTREFITRSKEIGYDDTITFKINLTLRLLNQDV